MQPAGLYAPPQHVDDPTDCHFYHTMELPGHGLLRGDWDLRAGWHEYLGGIDVRGQRVLEVGTASGFLCFTMERAGADLVAFDLSPEHAADVVPYAAADVGRRLEEHRALMGRINRAYWLSHRVFGSRARVVYGTVYALPEQIGPVDVATFGCVLLHLRDPFQALAQVLRLTRRTVVVTEPLVLRSRLKRWLLRLVAGPSMRFFPDAPSGEPHTTWWILSPEVIRQFLAVLGFGKTRVSYHTQQLHGRPVRLFTVVGERM